MKILRNNLLFSILIFVLLGLGALYLYSNTQNNIKLVFNSRTEEAKNIFDQIFELKNDSLEALAVDYTYWDELVDFINIKDLTWAEESLDTALETYDVDSIWVFNLQNEQIYSVTRSEEGLLKNRVFPLATESWQVAFADDRFLNFFVKDGNKIIEVSAATVHPSNDAERLTKPQGYFFVGRYLDSDYLNDLEKTTSSKISSNLESTTPIDKGEINLAKFTFYKPLKNYENVVIGNLAVEQSFPTVKKFIEASNRDFLILLSLGALFAISLSALFYLESNSLKRAEQLAKAMTNSLRESEQKYRLLAENSKEMVCLHKPDGTYEYLSPAVENITGYKAEELIGKNPYEYFHPEDVDRIRNKAHALAIIQKEPTTIEYRFKHKDGKYIWLETVTQPLLISGGKVGRIQTSSRDVTDRIEDQKELENDRAALERLNKTLVGRELKMVELKNEITKLKGHEKKRSRT